MGASNVSIPIGPASRSVTMPDFTPEGDLPEGVHITSWQEFQFRFGTRTSRRAWLFKRLQALVELAAGTGRLRRLFVWGSFVTK